MKKIILTTLTICVYVLSNAQEKANHNTTRSNQSNGIMVKEEGKDNDCDGVIDSKLFIKMTKSGTPDLNMHCCTGIKKSWEDATASAVKEASKKAHAKKHLFTNNGVTYYYNGDLDKLNNCKSQTSFQKCASPDNAPPGCVVCNCMVLCPIILDSSTIDSIDPGKDPELTERPISGGNSNSNDNTTIINHTPNIKIKDKDKVKRNFKKRNKNFNRKGERVKRTKF